jgi:hypothetical protein
MMGVAGLDEDEGVFRLDDEDDDEEEEIPEESCGAMDFGMTMEEYEPESYVPSAPRVTGHTPISSSFTNLPARRMSDEEFLGSNFTGSPRLQSALLQLHAQGRSRATTGFTEDRFGAEPLGISPPKA